MSFQAQKSFTRAFDSYEREARIQKIMAEELINSLTAHEKKEYGKILEIGCGTGFLTREILSRLSFSYLAVNDRIEKSGEKIRSFFPAADFLWGDAEKLILPMDQNLILSNAVFQWFVQLPVFFEKAFSALSPEGILAFTSFGPENFWEIKSVSGRGLFYYSLNQLEDLLAPGFEILFSRESRMELWFDDSVQALRHIRHTGVGGVSETILNPEELQRVMTRYQALFSDEKSVSLTYHPLWIIARRRTAWR